MRPLLRPVTMAASCLLTLLSLSLSTLPAEAEEEVRREHRLDFLDERSAVDLVLEFCDQLPAQDACSIYETSPMQIFVHAKPEHQASLRRLLGAHDVVRTRTFQVVLVRASIAGAASVAGEIPANVRGALAELPELLPYRRFELVDAGLLNASREGTILLAGSGGETFRTSLNFRNNGDQVLVDRFQMYAYRSPGSDAPVVRATSYALASGSGPRASEGPSAGTQENGQRQAQSVRQRVVSTDLGLRLGQTVVVGTSKLATGDEALVVLLTALPEMP